MKTSRAPSAGAGRIMCRRPDSARSLNGAVSTADITLRLRVLCKVRCGGVAEWSMAAVLKTAVPGRVPGVRIPPPPPTSEPPKPSRHTSPRSRGRPAYSAISSRCRIGTGAAAAGTSHPFTPSYSENIHDVEGERADRQLLAKIAKPSIACSLPRPCAPAGPVAAISGCQEGGRTWHHHPGRLRRNQ
jgi:hypothetical protein